MEDLAGKDAAGAGPEAAGGELPGEAGARGADEDGWPGLGQEVKEICKKVGLPDATSEEVDIEKEAVKEAIRFHHLQYLKDEMKGKKVEIMARSDMRNRRKYTRYGIEDCLMAFRLETFQFDCRANMPNRYGRDLRCRGCNPGLTGQGEEQKQQQEHEQVQEKEKEQEEQEQVESQEHLESCPGYSELWEGLGHYSLLTRCRFFQRVKLKRLQQKKKRTELAEEDN